MGERKTGQKDMPSFLPADGEFRPVAFHLVPVVAEVIFVPVIPRLGKNLVFPEVFHGLVFASEVENIPLVGLVSRERIGIRGRSFRVFCQKVALEDQATVFTCRAEIVFPGKI